MIDHVSMQKWGPDGLTRSSCAMQKSPISQIPKTGNQELPRRKRIRTILDNPQPLEASKTGTERIMEEERKKDGGGGVREVRSGTKSVCRLKLKYRDQREKKRKKPEAAERQLLDSHRNPESFLHTDQVALLPLLNSRHPSAPVHNTSSASPSLLRKDAYDSGTTPSQLGPSMPGVRQIRAWLHDRVQRVV